MTVLERLDSEGNRTGDLHECGSDCAAKLTGRKASAIKKEAKEADHISELEEKARKDKIKRRPAKDGMNVLRNFAKEGFGKSVIDPEPVFLVKGGLGVRIHPSRPEDRKMFEDEGFVDLPKGESISEYLRNKTNA